MQSATAATRCGGQRHLVADARRGAQEVRGVRGGRCRGYVREPRSSLPRRPRSCCCWPICSGAGVSRPSVRRHVRSRARRVLARRFALRPRPSATARPHLAAGPGARLQSLSHGASGFNARGRRPLGRRRAGRRAAIAHGVVTVNLATYAQVRLDARLRARDGAGIIEPAARRVRGRDGDRCAPGAARAGRGRRSRSMSGRCRCATAVPRGVRRSASRGRRAGGRGRRCRRRPASRGRRRRGRPGPSGPRRR